VIRTLLQKVSDVTEPSPTASSMREAPTDLPVEETDALTQRRRRAIGTLWSPGRETLPVRPAEAPPGLDSVRREERLAQHQLDPRQGQPIEKGNPALM
jgi:hypothetical protein